MSPTMDDGAMMGWTWPPIVGLVAMLAIITLLVVIVWALLDRTRRPHDPDAASQRITTGDPALTALRDRFARGEIDENEYDERRRPLEQRPRVGRGAVGVSATTSPLAASSIVTPRAELPRSATGGVARTIVSRQHPSLVGLRRFPWVQWADKDTV